MYICIYRDNIIYIDIYVPTYIHADIFDLHDCCRCHPALARFVTLDSIAAVYYPLIVHLDSIPGSAVW